MKLSENFDWKRIFYELFTEVNHYYDAEQDISHSNIADTAVQLKNVIGLI